MLTPSCRLTPTAPTETVAFMVATQKSEPKPPSSPLQFWREARGLTQAQLAEKVGTSQQQIDKLEKNQRKLTREWIFRLAPALDIPPGFLLAETQDVRDLRMYEIFRKLSVADKDRLIKMASALSEPDGNNEGLKVKAG